MIVIIDYQMGNSGSIRNMLAKMGVESVISSNGSDIERAEKLILPGVGAFDNGMKNITKTDLISVLSNKVIEEKTPLLGICLGMQLLTQKSEEGNLPGLGWFDAETVRFNFDKAQNKFKIPHMGWNYIMPIKENPLCKNLPKRFRFYFVHSYHVICNKAQDVLSTTDYGYEFVSAIQKENVFGVQFHPEKSHKFGMQLLKNFVEL